MPAKLTNTTTARAVLPEFFGVSDSARYLGVSTDTIRRQIASGGIPAQRLGKKILIRRVDLEAALSPLASAANTGVVA